MLDGVNAASRAVFLALMWPVERFGPAWTMVWLSAVTGVVCVWLFGLTSNQSAIEVIKQRISGNLIGVRLFQDDLKVVMGLQGSLIRLTLRYMMHSLIPMLVMMAPVMLILAQMSTRYDSRALKVGETALLKVEVNNSELVNNLSLTPNNGFAIDAPPVRIPAENEIVWRLRAVRETDQPLQLNLPGGDVVKAAAVGDQWRSVSPMRSTGVGDRLLYPAEKRLDEALGIRAISLSYPSPPLSLLGIELHWLVWFFILSMLFGFSVKGLLGVQI